MIHIVMQDYNTVKEKHRVKYARIWRKRRKFLAS